MMLQAFFHIRMAGAGRGAGPAQPCITDSLFSTLTVHIRFEAESGEYPAVLRPCFHP